MRCSRLPQKILGLYVYNFCLINRLTVDASDAFTFVAIGACMHISSHSLVVNRPVGKPPAQRGIGGCWHHSISSSRPRGMTWAEEQTQQAA